MVFYIERKEKLYRVKCNEKFKRIGEEIDSDLSVLLFDTFIFRYFSSSFYLFTLPVTLKKFEEIPKAIESKRFLSKDKRLVYLMEGKWRREE